MWQELVQQVGVIWIILVFLTTAGLIALTAFFFVSLRGLALASRNRLQKLDQDVDALENCRIENLKPVQELVGQQMNEDFQKFFNRLAEDSTAMFGSVWVPDPVSRLPLPDILPAPARAVFRKTLGSAVILGGAAVSALALSTGYAINGSLADAAFLRFLALMPLVISGIGLLVLHQAGEKYYQIVRHAWQQLMVSLERRLPVYTQAAETAIMLNHMKEYDARMSSSVQVLSDQVRLLASGKMSDAVAGAVKYVMSATVAPAITKSTESLSLLAQQLETRQMQAEQVLARLYAEMETRQHKQSDLWFKRYQEISEVLEEQQNKMLQNMAASQQELVDNLSKGQTLSLERINDEQHKTLMHVNTTTQKAWSVLQEKLTQIITQLAEGQTKLLTGLNEQQQQTLTQVSATSEKTAAAMRQQYDSIIDKMRQTQADIWEQLAARQTQAYDNLLSHQKESFGAVAAQQQQAYQQAAQAQQEGLQLMRSQQGEAIRQLT
ncbi:MAG TPA: hypothetical protein DD640_07170, partial [Clostridiales bacterium]|nr:hypothetical protein [Clostridiales bacterium]